MFEGVSVMDEVDIVPPEEVDAQVKAEKEEKIVPKGTWEGTLLTYYKVEDPTEREKEKFKGAALYKAGITFYDCPEPGKKKTGWFKFTTSPILNEKGNKITAYTSLLGLINTTNTKGQPVTEVLEQAKVTRCRYRVEVANDDQGNPVANWLKAVGPVR